MIVKGSFDAYTGRPYCQGLLFIPKLGKRAYIGFLVDTGSDVTTLNPSDGKKLGIPYDTLEFSEPTMGSLAKTNMALMRAIVGFVSTEGSIPVYGIQLYVSPYSADYEELPSQIGTDILRRWHINWNFPNRTLEFGILSYDRLLAPELFNKF